MSSPASRHPDPPAVSLGPVTRNPTRARVRGTGERHCGRTPIPSHVYSSSSTRVAKPSRRQAWAGPLLVGGCRGFRPLMTAFEGWTSPVGQIGNDPKPPISAFRGTRRSRGRNERPLWGRDRSIRYDQWNRGTTATLTSRSSHTSSMRQPLFWLSTIMVSALRCRCVQVAARVW